MCVKVLWTKILECSRKRMEVFGLGFRGKREVRLGGYGGKEVG